MDILDGDMQMVRDALAGAPEFAKGHFENLLAEYEKAAARVEELTPLQDQNEYLESERDELESRLDGWELERGDEMDELRGALRTVKDWFHDVMYLGKPMSDPRKILRTVEDALCES